MKAALESIYGDFLERQMPRTFVSRDFDLKPIPGKAMAFIGMRRVGKTYLCYQKIVDLITTHKLPRENIFYLNFEDDRLFGFQLKDCQTILDVFYQDRPEKKSEHCYFFFDEIQNVPNWERFIRRLLDTENVSVYVTGSSAKLLSLEIATGLRGRSLDREVFPYSFSEYLRAHQLSIKTSPLGHQALLKLNQQAKNYCFTGGLPELQELESNHAREVAQSYVDAVVLRDVVERHGVSNIEALRSLLYHVLRSPCTKLSVNKLYLDFKSRGLRVAKDDLYAFLRHLTDAYLFFQLPLWTRSEKKRQVNPKKIYIIDNGILAAYSTQITQDRGAFLENLVYITLRKQGLELGYYETKQGHEIDFVYRDGDTTVLVQASWTLEDKETREREIRALESASKEFTKTKKVIVTLDEEWSDSATEIQAILLWKFLLEGILSDS
ncbi:MAG: ATP-binding protein [Verrucomicrobiota bacterium]